MKLTTEQIATIEETLVLNGVVYDDIKLELLDHIATEIESECSIEDKAFEVILKEVFEKWKQQLRPASHNLWLGSGLSAPRIIVDKLANEKKRELFIGGIIVSLITVVILAVDNKFQDSSILYNIVFFLKTLSLMGALLMISGKLYFFKCKIQTTYLFRFNKSFYVILLWSVFIGIGLFPILPFNKNIEIKATALIITLAYLFLIYGNLKLFYKHFQFENRMKVI
ncbi:MAG: hypothetical protein ACI9M1_002047 [Porticoccaceae bacterium]|jgi:hypothetical protein